MLNILLNALSQREREVLVATSNSEAQVSKRLANILKAREFEERMKRYPSVIRALAQIETMAVPDSVKVSTFSSYASLIEEEENGQSLSLEAQKGIEDGLLLGETLHMLARFPRAVLDPILLKMQGNVG